MALISVDALIQAGHEGLTSGQTGASGPLGDEIDWTPIIADEATRVLRAAGLTVERANANFDLQGNTFKAGLAIFIHLDGSDPPGVTTASVGFSQEAQSPAVAAAWKELYKKYWPFGFMRDNFTSGLSHYYGYSAVRVTSGELLIEFGEISDLKQATWLKPRLKWLGKLVAHFVSQQLGKGNIADPGPFEASNPDGPSDAGRRVITLDGIHLGASIPLQESVSFGGRAHPDVKGIRVQVDGHALESASLLSGAWSLRHAFSSAGTSRAFEVRASDAQGRVLQTIRFSLPVGQQKTHLKLGEVKLGESIPVGTKVTLGGECSPETASITVTMGPGTPVNLGQVTVKDGEFKISRPFNSKGLNRLVTVTAFDSAGKKLQQVVFEKTVADDKNTTEIPSPVRTEAAAVSVSLFEDLVATYLATDLGALFAELKILAPNSSLAGLKLASLAQWILESGRGGSQLARLHGNFGGLKFRPEMEGFATKVRFGAHDGEDDYCKFADLKAFICGYWKFMTRSPYKGWPENSASPEAYLAFIGPTYSTKPDYALEVQRLLPEARQLMKGQGEGVFIDNSPVRVKLNTPVTISGRVVGAPVDSPVQIVVDRNAKLTFAAGTVHEDMSWSFTHSFSQAGNRHLEVQVGAFRRSVGLVVESGASFVETASKAEAIQLSVAVGRGFPVVEKEVRAVRARFRELGFSWVGDSATVDPGLTGAIVLFQSIVAGSTVLRGDGRIDVGGETLKWLNARNAPRWTTMPVSGIGFINEEAAQKNDHHDFGIDWLAGTIQAAAKDYEEKFRKGNAKVSKIVLNDVSLPHGGDTPDHAGHEAGNAVDIFLPSFGGGLAQDINDPNYDRATARAQLQAFHRQPLVRIIFFNDPVLIREGLCVFAPAHHHHYHVEIHPPQRVN